MIVCGLLVGVAAGAAAVLVHQWWWGLALGLAAAVATLGWLHRGLARVVFVVGWCVAVFRGAVTTPEGDYLVPANVQGLSLLGASALLVLVALATLPSRGGRAGNPPDRGDAT